MRFLRIDDVPPAWIIDNSRDPQPEIRPTAPPPPEVDVDEPEPAKPEPRVVVIEI
jgi:hypothetical protein